MSTFLAYPMNEIQMRLEMRGCLMHIV